jgi:hypothetical protein
MIEEMFASLRRLACLAACVLLAACASVQPDAYRAEKPVLELDKYFNGQIDAWGMVQDRSGKVIRRFTVSMKGTWNGNVGTLDEDFVYSDGKKEKRIWTITRHETQDGKTRYIGTASDVVGEASGYASGNALNWKYTLKLPVDGKVYEVQFDDWLWLVDDKVMLNKAEMTKFGFRLADITISFTKR